jgi:hypothetical protein
MAEIKAGGKDEKTYKDKIVAIKEVFNKVVRTNRLTEYEIIKDKVAVFLPLAVHGDNGGWIRTKESRPCINIPGPGKKCVTQIAIEELEPTRRGSNTEYALFVKEDEKSGYKFYGFYDRIVSKKDKRSIYFRQKKGKGSLNEWRAE